MGTIPEFYKRLRDLCEERNMTVNELVKILELSSGSPTAWKNGAIPRSATLTKIADYFGISVPYLTGEDIQKSNSPTEQVLDEGTQKLIAAILELPPEKQKALADLIGIDY